IKQSVGSLRDALLSSEGKLDEDKVSVLAFKITAGTYEQSKEWNEKFIKIGKTGKEMFVSPNVGKENTEGDGNTGDSRLDEYTNADLLERIMMILDYGFYEVFRLTMASLVVAMYNS